MSIYSLFIYFDSNINLFFLLQENPGTFDITLERNI